MEPSMTEKTVAEKLLIKPGMRLALVNPPTGYPGVLGLADGVEVVSDLAGADAVLSFGATQAEVEERILAIGSTIGPKTVAWIAYPKGSKSSGFDVNRDTIFAFAPAAGVRTVAQVALDTYWSALRLRKA
jgi:hypothetical protein